MPTCSGKAAHLHHIVYRSHCGPDDDFNMAPLCHSCHGRGVHTGGIRIRGRAGGLVTISLGFSSIDRALVEVASTMGADDRTVLRTVVLPLILPYLVSGYAFAFVLSLNEYIVAYMTVGFTMETLPIKIFNALRYGYTPTMAAVSVFFVALAVLIFGLIGRFGDLPRLMGAMPSEEK